MVSDFQITTTERSGLTVIYVVGEVDLHTCPQLHSAIQVALKNQQKSLILNFEEIQYIDSTGLGVVAHSAKHADQGGQKIAIVCTKPQIRKVFELSGLDKKIAMYDGEDQAIRGIR